MKTLLKILIIIGVFIALLFAAKTYGQSKTKITMTCEKDSISIEQLSKLIEDIQRLEKKYKLEGGTK